MKTEQEWMVALNAQKQHFATITRLQIKQIQIDALEEAFHIACDNENYNEKDHSISCDILKSINELCGTPPTIYKGNLDGGDKL